MTANVAAVMAGQGRRVGVIDTDIQSPGLHILFGLSGDEVTSSLNDYLWEGGEIRQAAHDVTPSGNGTPGGRIFLIPSSTKPGEITRILREGFDAQRLTEGLRRLVDDLDLDLLLIIKAPF
jgi:MinD-like ATPase involved in chromosome partitioning or flagellar assembly